MWKNQQNKPCPVCFSSHYIALWLMTAEAVLSVEVVKISKTAQHFQITAGWNRREESNAAFLVGVNPLKWESPDCWAWLPRR